ncbi:relaxase/mobilization nuclease domain-containing protein [Hyphomicrobium sp. DY-1]|uniref:relaxase/mobilization nuclease domain-containing protein n=1 Tax=Hyphomicrobium sp. DY-1 TaxID=3075650 RepID=UPI0039C31421
MIGKVAAGGKGFRGLYRYLMQGKKEQPNPDRVAWTETRNLLNPDPNYAPKQMRAVAAQSLRCEKPAYHLVLSWRHDENPSDELMRLCGDTTLADLELTEHQVVMIAHNDTAHRHLHLMINRVHPGTGKAWHTGKDYARIEKSVAKQAKTFDLIYVPGRHNAPEQMKDRPIRVKNGEFQMHGRKGGPIPKDRWTVDEIKSRRLQLQPIFAGARSWDQLTSLLSKEQLTIAKKGQGIIIADASGYMKLSDLGKEIRLKGLEAIFHESFDSFAERRALHEELEAQRTTAREARRTTDLATATAPTTTATDDEDITDATVHETLVDKPASPTAKKTRLRHSTGGDKPGAAYEEDDTASPTRDLDDDEKQRLREEARQRRDEEREQQRAERRAQSAAAASSDDEANAAEPDFHRIPATVSEPAMAQEPQDEQQIARSAAFEKLAAAREALDFAYSLGSLADRDQLDRAKDEVAQAEEDLARHQTLVEWNNKAITEKLAALNASGKPKAPALPPEPDDELEDEEEMGR